MGFGKNLKKVLDEKNKTVVWLSKETEIPSTTIYSMIKRDNEPRVDVVRKIASKLDVDVNDLYYNAEQLKELKEMEEENRYIEKCYKKQYGENWPLVVYAAELEKDSATSSNGYLCSKDDGSAVISIDCIENALNSLGFKILKNDSDYFDIYFNRNDENFIDKSLVIESDELINLIEETSRARDEIFSTKLQILALKKYIKSKC